MKRTKDTKYQSQYHKIDDLPPDPGNAAACRRYRARERDRSRKRREKASIKVHHVAANHGCSSRRKREAAIAELVVRRRCWQCEQVYEAKVKDEECPWCG